MAKSGAKKVAVKKRSRSAVGGMSSVSSAADRDLRVLGEKILAYIPEASLSWKFHNASFDLGGKVFAFTQREGIAMKLPETRACELVSSGEAHALVMGKRVMREWVVVPDGDWEDTLNLLGEAVSFVASLQTGK